MADKIFSAYVTNLSCYNEGALIRKWVDFPTTRKEMKQVFEEIGIKEQYEEYFITEYDCDIKGLTQCFGEYENLDMLNFLANKIAESDISTEQLEAMLEFGEHTGNVEELINLMDNGDCFWYLPEITDDSDLGNYYIEEQGILRELQKGLGILASYFDYEAYGRDIRLEEGGIYTETGGYITDSGDSFSTTFTAGVDKIPAEYRVQ